jgi:hypothetical protein
MSKNKNIEKVIDSIWWLLVNIENDIRRVRVLLQRIKDWNFNDEVDEGELKELTSWLLNYNVPDQWQVVEWVYDGLYMLWSDEKKYPVPLNYSSKSKLISWDVLKLTILSNGRLMYKLISPAPRTYIKATLSQTWNEYVAIWDNGKTYKLNPAAVTYFDLKVWDEMSIIINSESKWEFAAIESKL